MNYNVSVAACNCAGCGPNSTLDNVRIANITDEGNATKLICNCECSKVFSYLLIIELEFRLSVTSSILYKLVRQDEDDKFQITLHWEEPYQSCALIFRVKIETGNLKYYQNTSTTSANISQLEKGELVNFSVAGVNGKILGPDSMPPLTVYLQGE